MKTIVWQPDDCYDAIQSALEPGSDVRLPYSGGKPYVVSKTVEMRSRTSLYLDAGVTLEAKRGCFRGPRDCLVRASQVSDVSIMGGPDSRLIMHREDYGDSDYERGEWRHGVGLFGARSVKLAGFTTYRTGGDGIYVGADAQRRPSAGITLRGLSARESYRNSLTIASVDRLLDTDEFGLLGEYCYFVASSGTRPFGGVDIEPNTPDDRLVGVTLRHCRSCGHTGSGYLIALPKLNSGSRAVDVTLYGCMAESTKEHLYQVNNDWNSPGGPIVLENCVGKNCKRAAIRGKWHTSSRMRLAIEGCSFDDVATNDDDSIFDFDLSETGNIPSSGGIRFGNATVLNSPADRLWKLHGEPSQVYRGVAGDVICAGATAHPQLPNLYMVNE